MRTKSLQAQSIDALSNQLDQLSEQHFTPTLAIVLSSITHDLEEVKNLFLERDIDLMGASSAGEIYDNTVLDTSIVVLLMDMDKAYYRLDYRATVDTTTYQIAFDSGRYAKQQFANPAVVVFSGGLSVDAEQIVFGLKDGVGHDIPLYGGLAGDDLGMNNTFVFTNQKMTNDGILCLVVDTDKVEVRGMAACGWEAIGGVNTITKAEGNILYQINNEPALDVFLRYFGFFDNANISGMGAMMTTISGQYPLQIMRDSGDTILRSTILGNEEDRTLTLAGGVREGDQFRFSISPGFEVIQHTVQEFQTFKEQATEADALLLISCKGRHSALGPLVEQEVGGIYNHWNKPMIGWFSYGEIGKTKEGSCEFHNETCCLVLFKEK